MKSDGDRHKETYLDDRYFYLSLNEYLFVNKGKIFDAQGSWPPLASSLAHSYPHFFQTNSKIPYYHPHILISHHFLSRKQRHPSWHPPPSPTPPLSLPRARQLLNLLPPPQHFYSAAPS
jgi:hypothetical protein